MSFFLLGSEISALIRNLNVMLVKPFVLKNYENFGKYIFQFKSVLKIELRFCLHVTLNIWKCKKKKNFMKKVKMKVTFGKVNIYY